jgi:hypothetical protein
VPERGVSGADGRFRLELPRSEMPSDYDYCLVAACEGFGVDGAKVPRKDATAELTIRLVRDQPIEGRILGLEGRPIAGVEVSVGSVYASPEESVDPFLGGWRGDNWAGAQRCMAKMLFLPMGERLPATVFTDRDGRFRISGAGKERAVDLITKGDKVAEERFYVLTRSGFDPTPFNRASVLNTRQGPVPLLHGAKFDHVATVPRIIEGTIRDGVNRKPVAGVPISADLSQIQTFTSDERGRYRVWTSKRTQYELYVDPSSERGLLPRAIELLDKDGSAPIRVDIDLYHGVVVAGRLIDKATGKGVQGFVHFTPLGDTEKVAKKLGYQAWRETSKTDGDGRFRLITPPGNGFLAAAVHVKVARLGGGPINPYKQASIDPADRSRLTIKKDRTGRLYLGLPSGFSSRLESACKMLDVPQGATAATCDLFVDPGKSLIVKVQDPEGKPLAGAAVAGVMVDQMMEISLDTDECPVYGLDPDVPRRLLIFHQARNLAATMTVRGDETEPIVARLLPAGTMVGRLIDADGQPVADTWIEPDFQTSEAQGLYLDLSHKRKQVRTDKDGRFRMAGVIPDSKVTMLLIRGRRNLNAEAWASPKQVAVGQTLDVGDVRATSR